MFWPSKTYFRPDPEPDPKLLFRIRNTAHVHSDPNPAPEPNKIRINSDPDPTLKYKIFQKLKFLLCKNVNCSFEVLFSTNFQVRVFALKSNLDNMKTQVLLHKICNRILSAPDSDPNQLFGSGSWKKVRILSNPDPQHCTLQN